MQITKETINNSEIRLNLTISKLKTILLVCLISFTSLLVRQTLQIQHSCHPMIYSGTLPAKCQVATKDISNTRDRQKLPLPKQTDNKANTNNSKSNLRDFHNKTLSKPETQLNYPPNQIAYGSPVPTVENVQHDTETKSKNIFEKVSETVVEIAEEHPVEVASVGLVAGVAVTVAGLPLIGIPLAIAGIGSAIFSIFH